jgi:hypothetical protein
VAERDLEIDLMCEINRKSNEPAGAARAGRHAVSGRPVEAACLRAARLFPGSSLTSAPPRPPTLLTATTRDNLPTSSKT